VDGERGQRDARTDAAGGLQQFEQVAGVVVDEAVQRERVLAHDQAGRQPGLLAHPQAGDGARRAVDGEPDPADLDHDTVGPDRGDPAPDAGDHR
jgi:hypothetical protein